MAMNPSTESTAGSSTGTEQIRVLLFNVPRSTLDPATCFLARAPFAAESCAQADDLTLRLDKTAYKMIILNLPSAGLEPRDVIYTLRHQKHLSSKAVLVVLSTAEKIAEYQPYLGKGLSALLPLNASVENLESALAAILQVAPRVSTRVMVRLSAKINEQVTKHLCQAQNLSRTGMLVATPLNLPNGTDVNFELLLPDQPMPLTGVARVARHVPGVGKNSAGLGLNFTSFKMDGRSRLDAFLKLATPKP